MWAWYCGEGLRGGAGASLRRAGVNFCGTVVVGFRAQVRGGAWGAAPLVLRVPVRLTKSPQALSVILC